MHIKKFLWCFFIDMGLSNRHNCLSYLVNIIQNLKNFYSIKPSIFGYLKYALHLF